MAVTRKRHTRRLWSSSINPDLSQTLNNIGGKHVRRKQMPGRGGGGGGKRPRTNRDWWPEHLNVGVLHQNSGLSDPLDGDFDYVKEFQSLDLDAVVKDLHAVMTDFAGLVAGGFRPLRRPVHPHGLAQRRHLSHRRRARRRRRRPTALRATQQLAGQRQSRQGASPAVADQAEIRPEDFLGRSHDSGGQRRP